MNTYPLHKSHDISTALFDLDGTLVDSAGDITCALNFVLSQVGARERSIHEVEPLIGLPAEHLFLEFEEMDAVPHLVERFREQLAKISGTRTIVYSGVVELLESLKKDGWRLGVATNKPTALAEIVLEKCKLSSYFDTIVGSDSLPPKPDPAILQACIFALGCESGGVMVGDTVLDVRAGLAANLDTIGIAHSEESKLAMSRAGAGFIASSMQELWNLRIRNHDH